MQEFEKLGAFYLGKAYDLERQQLLDELLMYDAADLTTHGVCVGMTGSGKTGLGIGLLEEAALDGIPSIVIDPKGDMGNLLLTFPDLAPADFRPWIDEEEAARESLTPDELAARTAERWREGLAQWGQDGERIARLRAAAEMALYTPGSTAGLPLNVLHSFDAPPPELVADAEALGDRIESAVSGLLALLGIEADPVRSREHILLSNILHRAWSGGQNLDLAGLIQSIQAPGFEQIGVLDLEAVYPAAQRFELAIRLNNLLASPGFAPWLMGDPLDAPRLLYSADGRARVSVVTLSHLSDAERMFFVTLLLNEVLSWVRRQPGTSSLRAILYMDEVFGYFPPTAMPPAKRPMLTLLKQARAFGLGVLLATQNPVDLDYKGLANTGTWFIGRLQTERDKARLLDGLEGVAASSQSGFDRARMDTILSGLGKRVFLMHNVHESRPVVFQTRWAMSYLRGPLTTAQIRALTEGGQVSVAQPAPAPTASEVAASASGAPVAAPAVAAVTAPVAASTETAAVPAEVPQYYLPAPPTPPATGDLLYLPALVGSARLHYIRVTAGVDLWSDLTLLANAPTGGAAVDWAAGRALQQASALIAGAPAGPVALQALTPELLAPDSYRRWQRDFAEYVYQNTPLVLYECKEMKAISLPGETEGAFRGRLDHLARERRDEAVAKLRARYGAEMASVQDRIARAEDRLAREQAQYRHAALDATMSVGATLMGALLGRKLTSQRNLSRASSSVRGAGRSMRERGEVGRAAESIEEARARLTALESELAAELAAVEPRRTPDQYVLEELVIRARKNELTVPAFGLIWLPTAVGGDGSATPLWG